MKMEERPTDIVEAWNRAVNNAAASWLESGLNKLVDVEYFKWSLGMPDAATNEQCRTWYKI